MSFKCPFCSRTFSTKPGYSQHVSFCQPPSSGEESSLITDINNMSLDSEGFASEFENKVRNLFVKD